MEIIELAGVGESCEKAKGNLLEFLAGKMPDIIHNRTKLFCDHIMNGDLTRTVQV